VSLIVDRSSTSRRLVGDELRRWAQSHTAFISSEMSQLGAERDAVAAALRGLGMQVVRFEDLGGRDEDAVTAYLTGVDQSDIYIGIIADRYGRMQPSGRSATHEEYRRARERGRRISVWVAVDGENRQGDARDFLQEIHTFHIAGNYRDAADLARRIVERIAELAADDEAPWVKVGDAVFRAGVISDHGDRVEIEAEVRERDVARYLEGLRPDQWNRASQVRITTTDRSGAAEIEKVSSVARSTSARTITIEAGINWADGSQSSGAFGTSGYSHGDLVEIGIRAGLLGERPPEQLSSYGFVTDIDDLLREVAALELPEGSVQAVARLLVVESLVGGQRASSVDDFALGPAHRDQRPLALTYTETRAAINGTPEQRKVEGTRPWP